MSRRGKFVYRYVTVVLSCGRVHADNVAWSAAKKKRFVKVKTITIIIAMRQYWPNK